MSTQTQPLIERTEQKLRFAKIHLEELKNYVERSSADDFERSHQESFLFHLFGVRDAFLQELNVHYGYGLPMGKVTLRRLEEKASGKYRPSQPELEYIKSLEMNPDGWLSLAKEMRNYSTHQANIRRQFFLGGEHHRKIYLKQPSTEKMIVKDVPELFNEWFDEMSKMITKLRTDVIARIGS